MIKDNNNYLYLIVPNEYRCVYYNILDTLGTLGEDLLSSCTATCKGRAISGFACYNMFIAACAAYYLGQVKKARVLISYIKAQLEINCNKFIVFEDSSKDEWVFLKVPKAYQCVFEKLLNKLATWGQELLDDCTVSCKGNNKNILISWNLFNAACIGYECINVCKSDEIINYIKGLLGFNCPNEEQEDEEDYPTIKITNVVSEISNNIYHLIGLNATCDKPDKFNSDGLSLYIKVNNESDYRLLKNNITPENSMNIVFTRVITYPHIYEGLTLNFKLSGTGKNNTVYSDVFVEEIPIEDMPIPDDPIPDEPIPDEPGDDEEEIIEE